MDKTRYLACLESDYQRLRAVARNAADPPVPSCPEWTMTDLVRHVAEVYVDKTETMRRNEEQPWPPALAGDDPLTALDAAYAALVAELTARASGDTTATWYGPDQTVGFWVRRMAQETVIHRVDAEQAAGAEIGPVPDDLAEDGIDEVLVRFLSYMSFEYPKMLGERLAGCDGRAVLVDAGHTRWSVRLAPSGLAVSTGPFDATAARVTGTPVAVLLWLWRRADDSAVKVDGDAELVGMLRAMMEDATQ